MPGTTAKECYKRGKLLKLKSASEEDARDLSLRLINEDANAMTQKKTQLAIQKFIIAKLEKQKSMTLATVN